MQEHFGAYDGFTDINGKVYNVDADLNADGRINGIDQVMASYDNMVNEYDVESFEYDKNGNRTKLVQNGDEYTYEYGVRNRLEVINRKKQGEADFPVYVQYQYDANGNTTQCTVYGDTQTEVTTFAYHTMNRLVSTTNASGETNYLYDNAGNRFIKQGPEGTTLYLRHGQIAVAMDITVNSDQVSTGIIDQKYLIPDK